MMMKQLGERSLVTPFTVVLVLVLGDVYEMICSTAITYAKMADTLTHL
jgi:hypothetical protein